MVHPNLCRFIDHKMHLAGESLQDKLEKKLLGKLKLYRLGPSVFS